MPFHGTLNDTDASIVDGTIANKELANASVSFGGVSLSLGGSNATPAFNLSNAFNFPAGSLTGSTLNSGITASSLTSLGTLTSLDINGNLSVGAATTIFSNGTATFGGSITATSFIGALSGTASDADTLDGQQGSFYQNASNINAGTLNTARLPNTYTKAATVTIQATGAANDVIIDAADHIILESGEEEDGNIYFRGNGGVDSYRFSKSGQTSIEGFLSFESLTTDRTFTFPDTTGTLALTSSTVANATNAGDADTLDGQQGSFYQNASNINAGTLAAARLPSTMNATTFTGNLTIDNDADLRIGDGAANERILIQKADNNVSDHIIFYNATTRVGEIGCEDTTWLRINQETAKNIYTPRYIRADGGFFVDGTSKGINGDGNFIGGTIAGASDYDTLLRSDVADTFSNVLTLSATAQDVVNFSGSTANDNRGIAFNSRTALSADISDGYLRLNNASEFTNGVYTPGVMRADGGFFVDGTSKGINGSGNFIGGTIAGASDYSTLLRSDTDDTMTGQLTIEDPAPLIFFEDTIVPSSGDILGGFTVLNSDTSSGTTDVARYYVIADGSHSGTFRGTAFEWSAVSDTGNAVSRKMRFYGTGQLVLSENVPNRASPNTSQGFEDNFKLQVYDCRGTSNTGGGGGLILGRAAGFGGSSSAIVAGTVLGEVRFTGSETSGYDETTTYTGAFIRSVATESWTTSATGAHLEFVVSTTGSTSLSFAAEMYASRNMRVYAGMYVGSSVGYGELELNRNSTGVIYMSGATTTFARITQSTSAATNIGMTQYTVQRSDAIGDMNYYIFNRSPTGSNSPHFILCKSGGSSGDVEFRVESNGNAYSDGSFTGSGADYAEYFEWSDGNVNEEDRVGYCVVLDGDKIRLAQTGEEPFGVVSANPAVIGDNDLNYKGQYLKDDFNRFIWDEHDIIQYYGEKEPNNEYESPNDVDGVDESDSNMELKDYESHRVDEIIAELGYLPETVNVLTHDEDGNRFTHRRLNPDYDPTREFVPRENRPEWDTIGLVGKLRIRKGQPVGDRWIKMRDVSDAVEEWLVR